MIMANRSQLMSLVATNILGQNAAAIAATEAHYAEMWAQDAAAMYEYADASSGATRLVPFRAPTPIANPNQTAGQAASNVSQLTTLIRAIPPALQNLTSSLQSTSAAGAPTGIAGLLTDLGLTTPVAFLNPVNSALTVTSLGGSYWAWGTAAQTDVGLLSAQQQIGDTENQILERLGKTTAPPPTESTVSTTSGRAATLGGLSVPQGWVAQAPAIRLAALTSPPSMVSAALEGVSGSTPSFFSATDLAAAAMLRRSPGAAASQMPASQPMTSPPRTRATMLPAGLGGPLSGIAAELYHLAGLRELGILTTEEFDRQKSRLLGDT
jgi:PPE-repeat protein